jgi:ribosomal protein S18 acetylase RimI-like enzyme
MNIRVLTPADAEAYRIVRIAALQEEPAAFGSRPEDEPNIAETAERLAASDDRCFFGAFQNGQLVGIVRLSRYSAPNEWHRAFLGGLYVLPAFRREGCGRALVRAALDRAASVPGLRRINLSVVTRQAAAIRLYQSLDFRTYGTEHETFSRAGRFYDEHLMTLEIGLPEGTRPPVANWNVTTVADTSAPGCDLVRRWLREFNQTANPDFMAQIQQPENDAQPLVLLVTAASDIAGGLFAETRLEWLRISIMAVSPAWRSRGIGAALLAEAERQSVARGCKYAFVDTMDYQAPRFYLAHGFRIVGEIPDWDSHGHTKLFLAKGLNESAGIAVSPGGATVNSQGRKPLELT